MVIWQHFSDAGMLGLVNAPFDVVLALPRLSQTIRRPQDAPPEKLLARLTSRDNGRRRPPFTAHDVILAGLPGQAIAVCRRVTGLSPSDLADFLDVTVGDLASASRRKRLRKTMSDRLARLLAIFVQAAMIFGSAAGAARWFHSPNGRLYGRSPLDLIQTEAGAAEVSGALHAVADGIPA